MLKTYIEKLMAGKSLTEMEAQTAVNKILNGANPSQVAAFLVLLRAKKETTDEILGIVRGMRERMVTLPITTPVLDIVGTGGDGANTINVSTGAAILAASCGVKVAKHGNRSVSSQCGSADVLETLGVNINLSPEKVTKCIEEVGIGFCFAPNFHPAMKSIKEIRKSLAVPTCFNMVGPLLNPAKAAYLLIGVFNEELMHLIAKVVFELGTQRSLVFHGNGLDELSCIGSANVLEISISGIRPKVLDPEYFGFSRCEVGDLKGGSAKENAMILLDVFNGKPGAIADTLIFNAAVAIYIYGITQSIEQAIVMVKDNIKTGKVINLLNKFIHFNQGEYTHE